MIINTWHRTQCPECKVPNWVHILETAPVIEALKCHSCKHLYWLGDEEECKEYAEIMRGNTDIEESMWEDGKSIPC